MTQLEEALEAWRRAIGTEQVLVDSGTLEAAETATFATAQRVPAVLRPGSREEVQACLRIAHALRVPVFPVSAGRNYGYGSRVPARTGSVLLDLGCYREEEVDEDALRRVPSARNLRMMYWRQRAPPPPELEPDRDGCGFVWLSCAVPMTGAHVARALAIVEPLPLQFGFEPNLCLLGVGARCAYLVVALVYDRKVEGEDARALACYHALQQAMNAAGYYPARLGIQAPVLAAPPEDDSARVLATLKAALDPHGILAPGRYLP